MRKLYTFCILPLFLSFFLSSSIIAQTRIYVNLHASGANDGTNWTDAYTDLQLALAVATAGDSLWVARGTYYPTFGSDRDSSFELISGIALYGGFNGTENSLDNRNTITNQTILSGDLNDNDGPGFANTADNSYTVLYGQNLNNTTRLDGLYIEAGNANDTVVGMDQSRRKSGGGFYNNGQASSSLPIIVNCTFRNNQAESFGAAIYNNGAFAGNTNIQISDSQFRDNHCTNAGGAIHNDGRSDGQSNPTITKCVFQDNYAINSGGAIYNMGQDGDSSPLLIGCTFHSNETFTGSVSYAGAIYNLGIHNGNSSPTIVNCLFSSNRSFSGGAIYNLGLQGHADPTVINCTFYDNISSTNAGAIYMNAGDGTAQDTGTAAIVVINTIFDSNMAGPFGGDIFRNNYGDITINYSLVDVANCSDLNVGTGGTISCGSGMQYNVNPLFENPSAGNFQLQNASPALNAGDDSAISGYTQDLACNPRIITTVDLGAFENQSPLPVELLTFDAQLQGQQVQLSWTTTNETNNDYFTLEKSADGIHFEAFQQLDGAGTSRILLQYSHLDEHPFHGRTYYRLQQTDFDGRSTHSSIRVVEKQSGQFSVFPNPVHDKLQLSFTDFEEGSYDYQIFDLTGKQLKHGQLNVYFGVHALQLDAGNLQPGQYFIHISKSAQRLGSYRFVKVGM